MRRRAIFVFAIAASILVMTAPATAQTNLAVGGSHSDFGTGSGPTPTEMNDVQVFGAGESASIGLGNFNDGFENEAADAGAPTRWEMVTSPTSQNITTKRVYEGGQAWFINSSDTRLRARPTEQPYNQPRTAPVSTALYPPGNQVTVRLRTNVRHAAVGIRNGDLKYLNESGWQTISTDVDRGEWVKIRIHNISLASDTYDVSWTSPNSSGEATALSMENDMESGYTITRLFSGLNGQSYVDSFNIETVSPSDGTYISAPYSVGHAAEGWTDLTLSNATADIRWEYQDSGGSWQVGNSQTVSSTGNYSTSLPGADSSTWRVNVTFHNQSGDTTARLHDEGIKFTNHAPSIDSASPADGAETNQSSLTLSADVSDAEFSTTQGDTVTAEFYLDGELVDTKTRSSNGTVSTEVMPALGETHTWHVELTDDYGGSTSLQTRQFHSPAKLRVYYETNPDKLINDSNVTLTVRFFPLDGGNITTREVNDGVVNLTGLPVNDRFVVTVTANATDKFVYRRVVVNDLYETRRIFLLRQNKSHSRVVFDLQDPTGQFPPEETTLHVEKPITINGTTEYYTIAGDTFGATGRFPAVLQTDARYRLRVVTDGNERILGAYNVYGETVETLQIQRIEPSAEDQNTGAVYGSLSQSTNVSTLAVRFRGGEPNTTVTYHVTNESGDVVVPETTVEGKSFAHLYEFDRTGSQSYNVSYEITHPDGTTSSGSFVAGSLGGIADRFGVDPQVLSIMSWVAILATMGLVASINTNLAPAAGTGMATALSILGTVAIPMPILGISGAISVLTLFGGRR